MHNAVERSREGDELEEIKEEEDQGTITIADEEQEAKEFERNKAQLQQKVASFRHPPLISLNYYIGIWKNTRRRRRRGR